MSCASKTPDDALRNLAAESVYRFLAALLADPRLTQWRDAVGPENRGLFASCDPH
jgi:hypothetical protein